MSTRLKLLIGGAGALSVVISALAVVGYRTLQEDAVNERSLKAVIGLELAEEAAFRDYRSGDSAQAISGLLRFESKVEEDQRSRVLEPFFGKVLEKQLRFDLAVTYTRLAKMERAGGDSAEAQRYLGLARDEFGVSRAAGRYLTIDEIENSLPRIDDTEAKSEALATEAKAEALAHMTRSRTRGQSK